MSPFQNSRMRILYLTRFAKTPLTMIKHKFKLPNNSMLPTQRLLQLSAIHMLLLSDRFKKKKGKKGKNNPVVSAFILFSCRLTFLQFLGEVLLEKIKRQKPHICSENEISTIFILHIFSTLSLSMKKRSKR